MASANKKIWFRLFLLLTIVCILILLSLKYYKTLTNSSSTRVNEQLNWDVISIDSLLHIHSKSSAEQIVHHHAFSLAYDEDSEQALWVSYILTREQANARRTRRDRFRADDLVKTGSATLSDYKKSGYDRGHLAPAADMRWSKQSMSESFYLSNMSPQAPSFNQGIWRVLEEQVREWAVRDEKLMIATGPVFYQVIDTIGENEIWVPSHYYKIVVDVSLPKIKGIAFIMPNEKSNQTIYDFAVSIDSVEQVTGIDFMPNLPELNQMEIESNDDWLEWR